MKKTPNKLVLQDLEVSSALYAGMWHTTSVFSGRLVIVQPFHLEFGEETLI